MGRWGEKVPAAVGTVANRFARLQSGVLHLEGPWFAMDGTEPTAGGAGLLLAQGVGLLFQEGLQGALRQTSSGGAGDLLHGIQIDVQPRAAVAEGASGD